MAIARSIFYVMLLHLFISNAAIAQPILDTKFVGAPKREDFTNSQNPIRLTFASDGTMLVQTLDGIFRSTSEGATWINIAPGASVDFTFGADSTLYLATQTQLLASSNFGNSWMDLSDELPAGPFSSIAETPNGTLIVGCPNGLYRSTNRGGGWDHVAQGQIGPFATPWISVTPKGTVLARSNSVYLRSEDDGMTWSKTIPLTQRFYPVSEDNILRQGDGVIERSTDDGLTWKAIPGAKSQYYFDIVKDAKGNLNRFYSYQIMTSSDGGTTWKATATITGGGTTLAYSQNNTLYYGTATSGIWRTLKPLSKVATKIPESSGMYIDQATGDNIVHFDLEHGTNVTLSVIDVRGIECFVSRGSFERGKNVVHLGHPLLPGIYWCVLRAKDETRSAKFIVN